MAYLDVKYKEPMFPHQKYEDRLVAFIDVLGFSNLVDDTKCDEQKLRHLTAGLDTLYNRIWAWEADGVYSSFAFTQFSDSIVISALAESSDSFAMLQQLLLGVMELVDDYDILVRGGIARGQLIHDRTMVVGPAMVEAYHLESKEAKYPRIIIEKGLKEQIEADIKVYVKEHYGMSELPSQDNLFKTDEDGWCYLDYVNPVPDYFEFLDPEDHFKLLDRLVKKGLQSDKEEVRKKYPWLKKKVELARSEQSKAVLSTSL